MRVEVDPAVLTGAHAKPLFLLGILAMGSTGRHQVLFANREAAHEWICTLPPLLQDEVQWALDDAETVEVLAPASAAPAVQVGPTESDSGYAGDSLRLSLEQAHGLLARPLRVILENGMHDRSALLAFASPARLAELRAHETRGWLEFVSGGGIDGCLQAAKALAVPSPHTVRTLIMTDCDGLREHESRSERANQVFQALSTACEAHGRAQGRFGLVLTRRAIENYLPGERVLDYLRASHACAEALIADAEAGRAREFTAYNDQERWVLAAWALSTMDHKTLRFIDMCNGERIPPDVPRQLDIWRSVLNRFDVEIREEALTEQANTLPGRERTDPEVWDTLNAVQQKLFRTGLPKAVYREVYTEVTESETAPPLHDRTGELTGFLDLIQRSL